MKALAAWDWFEQEKNMPSPHCCSGIYPALVPFNPIFKEMDKMLHDFWGFTLPELAARSSHPESGHPIRLPKLDITGDEKKYAIDVELPGIEEKDVRVEVKGKTLVISAEKPCGCEKKDDEEASKTEDRKPREGQPQKQDYYCQERSYGYYRRILTLPDDADSENITGTFKHGVLALTIPRKASPKVVAKKIAINPESSPAMPR